MEGKNISRQKEATSLKETPAEAEYLTKITNVRGVVEEAVEKVGEQSFDIKNKVLKVLRSADEEGAVNALREISEVLVGEPDKYGAVDQQISEIQKFIEDVKKKRAYAQIVVYLNDGGFSRLVLNYKKGQITVGVSYNSTKIAKDNWAKLTGKEANETISFPLE